MRIPKNHWLITKPIAHRGLWGENVIENSLTAYEKACKFGFPIEIDVFLTKDNHIVSFHDDNLFRMTGVNALIYNKTLTELKELSLLNTEEKIPTFNQVLKAVDGKVPLLIEIKNQPNPLVVNKLIERLKSYSGEFAIQSFNPLYINKVKKLAPSFIRGILCNPLDLSKNRLHRFIVRKMPLNFLIKPHFISAHYKSIPLKNKSAKRLPVIAWTVTDKDLANTLLKNANNIIFEKFVP